MSARMWCAGRSGRPRRCCCAGERWSPASNWPAGGEGTSRMLGWLAVPAAWAAPWGCRCRTRGLRSRSSHRAGFRRTKPRPTAASQAFASPFRPVPFLGSPADPEWACPPRPNIRGDSGFLETLRFRPTGAARGRHPRGDETRRAPARPTLGSQRGASRSGLPSTNDRQPKGGGDSVSWWRRVVVAQSLGGAESWWRIAANLAPGNASHDRVKSPTSSPQLPRQGWRPDQV